MDPFEIYVLHNVSTDINVLTSGSGGIAAFEDIGTGTGYGGYKVSAVYNSQFVSIALNVNALKDINNATGLFAIGGSVSTIDLVPNNELIFVSSGEPGVPSPNLVLTSVPVPAAVWLFCSGLLGYIGVGVSRIKNRTI